MGIPGIESNTLSKLFLVTVTFVTGSMAHPYANAAGPEATVSTDIVEAMETFHIPGLSACTVRSGAFVWSGAFGVADFDQDIAVADTTLFTVASVAKTVTCTAIMQLQEAGHFELDDDVNNYLPFSVRNPAHPDDPITFTMLLTHSSGIRDDWNTLVNLVTWDSDSPLPLGTFVEEYLVPGGLYYTAAVYVPWAPGEGDEYSNVAVSLLAYIVETISGESFPAYCEEHIFNPLGMQRTAWLLADVNLANLAMPYQYWEPDGQYYPYGQYRYPWYPAGLLMTTPLELGRFLTAMMQGGGAGGVRILEQETVDNIFTVHNPDFQDGVHLGLIWAYGEWLGRWWWSQAGSQSGMRTVIRFNPDLDVGVIVLTNGESYEGMEVVAQFLVQETITAVHPEQMTKTSEMLTQVSPNPFNPRTTVSFTLPTVGQVQITIYDAKGQMVARLVDESLNAGANTVEWDGRDAYGASMPSGTYFCRLTTAWGVETRKMSMLR